MNVERGIAGISITFATGIFISAYIGSCLESLCSIEAGISLTITSALLFWVMSQSWSDSCIYTKTAGIFILMFCCGAFCGFSAHTLSISHTPAECLLTEVALRAGERMKGAIDSIEFLSPTTGPLLKALLSGDKSDLSHETTLAFRSSGASHILALSGLHLGIIYIMIRRLLAIIGNTRWAKRTRSVATICLCGFYTLATGAGASISRAFLFIFIKEAGEMTGRPQNLHGTLMTSLLIQLALSPLAALNVGFQLSYAAMAGIAYIHPRLRDVWEDHDKSKGKASRIMAWIWNSAALSISCQITTGPLAYLYFGTFPEHFLLTNLIALPLTGILIPVGILALTLSLSGICPDVLLKTTELLSDTLIGCLTIISEM